MQNPPTHWNLTDQKAFDVYQEIRRYRRNELIELREFFRTIDQKFYRARPRVTPVELYQLKLILDPL